MELEGKEKNGKSKEKRVERWKSPKMHGRWEMGEIEGWGLMGSGAYMRQCGTIYLSI